MSKKVVFILPIFNIATWLHTKTLYRLETMNITPPPLEWYISYCKILTSDIINRRLAWYQSQAQGYASDDMVDKICLSLEGNDPIMNAASFSEGKEGSVPCGTSGSSAGVFLGNGTLGIDVHIQRLIWDRLKEVSQEAEAFGCEGSLPIECSGHLLERRFEPRVGSGVIGTNDETGLIHCLLPLQDR
jgi:hypothetical protein